jgi:hypothetical protein
MEAAIVEFYISQKLEIAARVKQIAVVQLAVDETTFFNYKRRFG